MRKTLEIDVGNTHYFYDAEGSRNLKLTQSNSYMTEYETWQGQTLSQLDGSYMNVRMQDGGSAISLPFTDYIYANGSRIAEVQSAATTTSAIMLLHAGVFVTTPTSGRTVGGQASNHAQFNKLHTEMDGNQKGRITSFPV